MIHLIKYLSTFIPPRISTMWGEFEFQLFINGAHDDIRVCYATLEDSLVYRFLYLRQGITSDEDLHLALISIRAELRLDGLLTNEYATEEGYTYEKYLKSHQ